MTLNLDKTEWKRVTLGEVAAASKERVDPRDGSVDRYIAGEHMDSDDLKIHRWGVVGEVDLGPAFHRRVRQGQVLYGSRRTYLRKVAVADFDGVCANTTFVVETKDETVLLQEFLPFLMTAEPFHAFAIAASKGSVNPYVNWSDIERYEVDLPSLDEQRRIADLLWALERHKRKNLSSALLQVEGRLLEGLITDRSRPQKAIADLGSVTMGRQRSPRHSEGDHMVPYLRVANVGDGELRLQDVKRMNFTPDEQARYSVLPGDILISEGQSRELVGQSVLVTDLPEPMCFQNTLIRFRARESQVRAEFAQALFRACLKSGVFAEIATQTTSIAHLGVQRFAQLQVPVPPLSEQDDFLADLARLRRADAATSAELAALEALSGRISADIFGGAE